MVLVLECLTRFLDRVYENLFSTAMVSLVVLTHDAGVAALRRALDEYPLVYGIREAKGLEFQEVVLVDFFAGVPEPLQKLWRDLWLGRDTSHVSQRPEIEGI
jgi:hypothetical protein